MVQKHEIDTCMRVLASSIGEQVIQANDRATTPATGAAYGVKLGAFADVNSSSQLRKMS